MKGEEKLETKLKWADDDHCSSLVSFEPVEERSSMQTNFEQGLRSSLRRKIAEKME